jgi:hypothetical protein
MARYHQTIKERVLPAMERAFPEGVTTEQIEAIKEAMLACRDLRQSKVIMEACKQCFPGSKWTSKTVYSEKFGKSFEIFECTKGT